jgi:regulator of RNase E activity RraA
MPKTPLGRLPREAIRLLELPRLPKEICDGFSALVDLTGTISDALDKVGIVGAIAASELFPVNPGRRLVGPALTVRNVKHSLDIHKAALENLSGQGESEAHNLAEPGDVLVIEGIVGCSNMGGQSATMGRRQGEAGAIVDGSIRDPDQYREMGWPVWCRGFTPITGKWRTQTVEVNGTVMIAGVLVKPGDLACADNAGICFVPRERAVEVLEVAREIDAGDTKRKRDIERGTSVSDLMTRRYK